jgi:hypothetical protein
MNKSLLRVELDVMTSMGVLTFKIEFDDPNNATACYRAIADSLSHKNMVEEVRYVQEVSTVVSRRVFPNEPR